MDPTDETQWSQQTFGGCELGDARRTQRLVDVGARKARNAKLLLRSATLELLPPTGSPPEYQPLTVSVVLAEECDAPVGEPEATCESVLSADEWKVLWVSTRPKEPLPQKPPSARWAFNAIARLGGFTDTKRTGRPGWDTIWYGWFRLQERLEGVSTQQVGAC